MTHNTLTVDHLSKSFNHKAVVSDVSLTLAAGECLALLGPNGAGKSTTLEMLVSLIQPDSGSIQILGLSQKDDRKEILAQVGVQLQETNLYKRFTVLETLQLFASFYPKSVDLQKLMVQLGIAEKSHTKIRQLSGGQKQRLYLGCALVNNPKLLILDEPTTGLDPQTRRYIWDHLWSRKTQGGSIFLTTHSMEEAEFLADRVAIMDHGKIITVGSPKELIRNYCPGQIMKFSLKPAPELVIAEKIRSLKSHLSWLENLTVLHHSCETLVSDAAKKMSDFQEECARLNIDITELHLRAANLEDVFLKLTGRKIRDDVASSG